MNKVLITGGAGVIGSHLCERLLSGGSHVWCLDDLSTGRWQNIAHLHGSGFTFELGDVSCGPKTNYAVDLVMHLASPASPMDYHRLPHHTMRAGSQGTLNALELARAAGARFLLASTSEVYGDPLEHPQSESYLGNVDCRGPRSVYDESKRFAEAATSMYRRSYGVRTSIARIFNTYGPRMREDEGRMVPTFITQCLRGTPLTVAGDGQQTRSLCYVEDLVEGLLRLADSGHPGPVNLGNPDEHRVIDYAQIIRELTGSRSTIRHVRLPTDDPRRRRPDISLAQRVLGWSPTIPLNEGLAKTIDWYRTPRAPVENGGFAGLEVDAASLSHTAAPS